MRERRTASKAAKPWDRALVPVMTGLPFVAVIVAGLGKRLGCAGRGFCPRALAVG